MSITKFNISIGFWLVTELQLFFFRCHDYSFRIGLCLWKFSLIFEKVISEFDVISCEFRAR